VIIVTLSALTLRATLRAASEKDPDLRTDRSDCVDRGYRNGVAELLRVGLLLLLCAVFAWLRWAKLDELLQGDPVHWLHEVARVAGGELPYRDFSFQYPPFAAFFFGWMLHTLGATFVTASILVDFWSFTIVLLCFAVGRFLLPPTLRLPVGFLVICVCATSLTNFNLFSYRIYSPALQTGAAGALLSLLGMLRVLRNTAGSGSNLAAIACGSAIALLSKPEFALADVCALALFTLLNQRRWWNVKMLAISTLPAAALYAWLAHVVGLRNLMAGVSGYGLASFACPWWPTGIGVFGVAAALGEALLIASVVSFPWRRDFHRRFGSVYTRMLLVTIPGTSIYLAYIYTINREALTSTRPLLAKATLILPSLAWSGPVLLPIMWSVILLFFCLIGRCLRNRGRTSTRAAELLLALVFPVSMSPRTWFGSTQGVMAEVPAACYPFLLILGPYLLWSFLSKPSRTVPAAPAVASLVIAYGLARLLGGVSLFTEQNYRRLETAAGVVRISDHTPGIEVYRYVATHTAPSEYVLELPYGGGINFAASRRNPIFDTMLFNMEIPVEYQQKDLERISQRRPKVIVAEDVPQFGTNFSFGTIGNRACVCPRLVWMPDRPSWDPNHVYPLISYIARNYHPVVRIGGKMILEANP
jgi:hypothetical protein